MLNKQLLMNELKIKTLKMMSTDYRASMSDSHKNNYNKAILPEELKKTIDKVYRSLSEIASDNRVATSAVEQLIEGKRLETNIEAQDLYQKKTVAQLGRIREEMTILQNKIENDNLRLEQEQDSVIENIKDEQTNEIMGEKIYKNIVMSVNDIQRIMNKEILERTANPMEARKKLKNVENDIVKTIRSMGLTQNIKQILDVDDEMISTRVNRQLEDIAHEMNKTDRQRFMESVKVENPPKLPDDIFEEKEEMQKDKTEKKGMMLDPFVLE